MPKEIRWKIILILFVLAFSLIAVYPVTDKLVYRVLVTDTLNENDQPITDLRERATPEEFKAMVVADLEKPDLSEARRAELQAQLETLKGQFDKNGEQIVLPVSYYAHRFTFGIFHTFKEKYGPAVEERVEGDKRLVTHRVDVYLRGLTLGLDLTGGAELSYDILFGKDDTKMTQNAEEVKKILEERVNALGLKEPVIQLAGNRRIPIIFDDRNLRFSV